jgi:hypothetical protein
VEAIKMGEVKIYNRMYKNGKPIGRAYVSGVVHSKIGETKEQAIKRINRENATWNRKSGNKIGGYRAKFVSAGTKHYKKIGAKKRSTGFSPFGFRF